MSGAFTGSTMRYVRKRPLLWQLQEAILKNICAPSSNEMEEFTISRFIRASGKMEGDSQLGILLFIGLADRYDYPYAEIANMATVEYEEYRFKLSKYKRKCKSNDSRFLNKKKLIENYLRLKYGV